MSFTLCTSGAIVIAAGANVNSSAATSGAILQQFSDEAEGEICENARYDAVANYTGLTSAGKLFLGQLCSNIAGMNLIKYDMSGYTGRGEAEDMINVLYDTKIKGLKLLQDDKFRTFIGID